MDRQDIFKVKLFTFLNIILQNKTQVLYKKTKISIARTADKTLYLKAMSPSGIPEKIFPISKYNG